MSGQSGILHFDARPIEPDVLDRMQAQLAAFGPDGAATFSAPGLAMAHSALHVTPEDRLERQPHLSARGNVMTWDGRLDNREQLLWQLRRDLRDDTTDVAIALAAYERWGVDTFARLVGDWSLAIYDAADQTVVLASDFMGVRPLYYWRTDRLLAWSSSLAALVSFSGRDAELEPRYVLGQLVGFPEPDLTPYRDVPVAVARARADAAPIGGPGQDALLAFRPRPHRLRQALAVRRALPGRSSHARCRRGCARAVRCGARSAAASTRRRSRAWRTRSAAGHPRRRFGW